MAPAGVFDPERPGAAEAETEAGRSKHEILFKVINVAILVGALGYVLRKPLREFFVQRSASIQKSLEEGRKALEASQAQLQAVEEKLARFEEEMAACRAAALEEMKVEREHMRQASAQEASKMLESVRIQMEVATKQARLELKHFAAQQAVDLAQQMISQRLDEASQRRLVAHFVARLEEKRVES